MLTIARALGEFGAVSVVCGEIAGSTETLTVVRQEPQFEGFDTIGAYHGVRSCSPLIAVSIVVAMHDARRRTEAG